MAKKVLSIRPKRRYQFGQKVLQICDLGLSFLRQPICLFSPTNLRFRANQMFFLAQPTFFSGLTNIFFWPKQHFLLTTPAVFLTHSRRFLAWNKQKSPGVLHLLNWRRIGLTAPPPPLTRHFSPDFGRLNTFWRPIAHFFLSFCAVLGAIPDNFLGEMHCPKRTNGFVFLTKRHVSFEKWVCDSFVFDF